MINGMTVLSGLAGGQVRLVFPDIAFTGDFVRRFQVYQEAVYAEYELRTSGTLTVGQAVRADFYLVPGGGRGGNGTWITPEGESSRPLPAGGGGSGYALAVLDQEVEGTYSVVIGGSEGNTELSLGEATMVATRGGNGGTWTNSENTEGHAVHGEGFQGTYYAYDDPAYPIGTAAYTAQSRNGSNGCSVLARVRGARANNFEGIGYGAGGGGGTVSGLGGNIHYEQPAQGAPGVVLLRVKVGRSRAGTGEAQGLFDISGQEGSLIHFVAEGAGTHFSLREDGELVYHPPS